MISIFRNIPKIIARTSSAQMATKVAKSNFSSIFGPYSQNLVFTQAQKSSTHLFRRYKSKKSKDESDDEDDDYNEGDSSLSRDSKVVKFSATSMRTDMILKSGLGVARNKIEQAFYESRIRVNGKKIMKKSAPIRGGDEVDVIKAVSAKNPEHLHVSRLEILSAKPSEDHIAVTVRRFKSLLIENYEEDPYKTSATQEEE